MRMTSRTALMLTGFLTCVAASSAANEPAKVPDDFPRFVVPGHEKQMESLRRLFWLH